ncbi:glutathione peroxidase [Tremella mesenterica]|uniref:Glutathione peroxidase n=1 Tax=Tremella mesenterica TaxID=5217 RepID=A0A4Q1BHY1_TREME|nr:glutathione peroxidase [Tremella mesenterica]
MSDIYSFTVQLPKQTIPLSEHKDKTLLFVNVASKCGLTPQYKDLQTLYEKYNPKGLEIIGFPCNQFKGQEPGTDQEVLEFCQLNYGVTFPLAVKADVNGPETQPLWAYLKSHAEPPVENIDWNFSKFLVKDGKVVWFPARSSKVSDVEAALGL